MCERALASASESSQSGGEATEGRREVAGEIRVLSTDALLWRVRKEKDTWMRID